MSILIDLPASQGVAIIADLDFIFCESVVVLGEYKAKHIGY